MTDNITKFYKDLNKFLPHTLYAARFKLKSEIIDSRLGCLWWIIEPTFFMLVYMFVFGYLFDAREDYYALFIFIGVTAWDFFSKSLRGSVHLIKKNHTLLNNVYMPKYLLVIQIMLVNGFKMIINLGICFTLVLCFKIKLTWYCLMMVPLLVMLFLITFGFSCFAMHFGVFISDLENVINIALKVLFYLTGIFYSIPSRFPEQYCQPALMLNPVACLINELRESLIYGGIYSPLILLLWFVISASLSISGIWITYKNENSYLKVN